MKQIFLYLLILNFFCFHFYELLSIDIKTNKITAHITVKSYLNKKSNSPALLKDKEKIGKFRIHDGLFTCQGGAVCGNGGGTPLLPSFQYLMNWLKANT